MTTSDRYFRTAIALKTLLGSCNSRCDRDMCPTPSCASPERTRIPRNKGRRKAWQNGSRLDLWRDFGSAGKIRELRTGHGLPSAELQRLNPGFARKPRNPAYRPCSERNRPRGDPLVRWRQPNICAPGAALNSLLALRSPHFQRSEEPQWSRAHAGRNTRLPDVFPPLPS